MKKRFIAFIVSLSMALCFFNIPVAAESNQRESAHRAFVNKPAQNLDFYDSKGKKYTVWSGTLVSQGSSLTGYVLVIQEVLHRLYQYNGNNNLNPHGVDGIFGDNTRLAVICFQNRYISGYYNGVYYDAGDGVVGANTWWYLHNRWSVVLGSPNLTSVVS